ncbi:MAG: LuxR C-terminal-related transcriptional regulator, partial [Bradyrhizobium sp.]
GIDILKELTDRNYPAPVFIMSGHCSIPMAVQAIKDGAFDLIEKPFDPVEVVVRVRETIDALRSAPTGTAAGILPLQFPGRDLLTAREREILVHIALGQSNKESGRSLGVSPRTIEVHRARVMEKMGARNAADLVRIVFSRRGHAHATHRHN